MEDPPVIPQFQIAPPLENERQYTLKNDYPLVLFLLMLALIVGWILVNLWTRCIENIAYVTFQLNINSSWHTFIVAMTMTIIGIGYLSMLRSYRIDLEGGILHHIDQVNF
jgi:hypothetical protein